jgi:hypothetical protein
LIARATANDRGRAAANKREVERVKVMLDIIFIAATALFFAIGILYVRACERLK